MLLSAAEYLKLKEQGVEVFVFDTESSLDEDLMFEMLGELVEQHPVGRPRSMRQRMVQPEKGTSL